MIRLKKSWTDCSWSFSANLRQLHSNWVKELNHVKTVSEFAFRIAFRTYITIKITIIITYVYYGRPWVMDFRGCLLLYLSSRSFTRKWISVESLKVGRKGKRITGEIKFVFFVAKCMFMQLTLERNVLVSASQPRHIGVVYGGYPLWSYRGSMT